MSSGLQDQVMSVGKIGRYEIIGELGKGAMGVVYKARDPNIGRTVALKTMRLDIHGAEHDAMVQRFQNEARAAGLLNHPNIVTIYDAGEADGIFYIAMEYIEGQTLASLLFQKRTLSATEVVEIGTQICAGLQYAHFRKVIHRDIKPANIMISAHGGPVKIMDFGIAKAGASLTHTGEVVGTPHYMSPEQVKGLDLDGRSDLFSTGVVLYEMVTGEKPFNGESVTTIIYKIVNDQPIPPRELDVTVHAGLSQVIIKCLSKDPEDRYQEADDLGTALKSYKFVSFPEPRTFVGSLPVSPGLISSTHSVLKPTPPRPIGVTPPPMNSTQLVPAARTAAAVKAATAAAATVEVPVAPTQTQRVPQAKPVQRQTLLLFAVFAVVLASVALLVRTLKSQAQTDPATTQAAAAPADPIAAVADSPKPRSPRGAMKPQTFDDDPAVEKPSGVVSGVGNLRITSNPPGAQVAIDGVAQAWYVTPFNAPPMKPGAHMVSVSAPGFPPQTRQVQIVADQKTVADFQLTGNKAVYNISSVPNGAEIFIDGAATGAHTPAQIPLVAGAHKVALRLDGFQPIELMTNCAPGESVNLSPQLQARNSVDISGPIENEPQSLGTFSRMRRFMLGGNEIPAGKGLVLIRTRPKGVMVSVAGFNIARPTPLRVPIRPGMYTVTLQKSGFQSITRTIQVEEGKVVELDEAMVPQE